MSKCVYCFSVLPQESVRFMCVNTRCSQERVQDDTLARFLGRAEVKVGLVASVTKPERKWPFGWPERPTSMSCPKCAAAMQLTCPTCHHTIPNDSLDADVVTVGFTGARNSGKSVAIGSMSFFLRTLVENLGSTLRIHEQTSENTLEWYVDRLFAGEAPAPTDAGAGRSLVFSLGNIKGQPRYLSLRDIAGEDLQSASPKQADLSFLSRADLVLFLFDPLAIEGIRHQLEDLIPAQGGQVGAGPVEVLGNVLHHVGAGSPRLAVAVAKVDALQELAVRPGTIGEVFRQPGGALNRDWPIGTEYHEQDARLLHDEVRSLLRTLGGTSVVNMVENPASKRTIEFRFFAISALGGSTDVNEVHDHGIRPYRILEPILWVFASRGIVDSVK